MNGEVLLKLQSADALPALLTKYQLTLVNSFGSRPIYRLKLTGGGKVATTIKALLLEPGVLLAEPNYTHRSPEARKNNVWAFGTQEEYADQWAPQAMRLPQAHAISTGAGVRVAVLDSGIDLTHPALAGRLVPGFDFVDFDTDPSEGTDPQRAGYGHGTHVAGIIAMVAPGAQIMPLRVLDLDGVGNAWVLSEAMLHAVDPDHNPATNDGAQVINVSLGSQSRTELLKAISQLASCNIPAPGPEGDFTDPGYDGDKQRCALSKGAVVAVAAGNSGTDRLREYPAAESAYGKIAVGASTSLRTLADYSNFGSWVDLAAPGDKITSTFAGGTYATWSGTSMASPMVAGTAALVRAALPGMNSRAVVDRIDNTTSLLCKTKLRQVDPLAALTNANATGKCR